MPTIPHEFAPTTEDTDISSLCHQLVPNIKPVLVPIRPWRKSREKECYGNVEKYVLEYGGERVLGWRPLRWANIMVEAEAHAVWRSPIGELVDITPYDQTSALFLPDPNMKYEGHSIPNIRKALTGSPLVAELIEISNQQDMEQARVKSGGQYSISYSSYMRKMIYC